MKPSTSQSEERKESAGKEKLERELVVFVGTSTHSNRLPTSLVSISNQPTFLITLLNADIGCRVSFKEAELDR
jgi:hypothetical protein